MPPEIVHLIDVPLIDGIEFANIRATFTVNDTQSFFRQQGTPEDKTAALAALATRSASQRQLMFYIFPSEMNQIKPSELAD